MPKEAMFTLKLEAELRDSFMSEAAAMDRPASQIVREFMREFVQRQRDARDHEAWFRAEVEIALRAADDPAIGRISNDEVAAKWRRDRDDLARRGSRRGS